MEDILVGGNGRLRFGEKEYRCALGRSGVRIDKIEGDGATPLGCFLIRKVFFRPDKFDSIKTILPAQPLSKKDGWSDDPGFPEYNTHVELPYAGSHEKLWRNDGLYDLVVVLGYNDDPPVPGMGSAIFMHVARKDYAPTNGCIALSREDLLELLSSAPSGTRVCIQKELV